MVPKTELRVTRHDPILIDILSVSIAGAYRAVFASSRSLLM